MKEYNFSIKQWSLEDRPREKLCAKGKSVLTDAELLAILIGSGSKSESAVSLCRRILASVNNDLNALGRLSVSQLQEFKGIGEAKAIAIVAALELGRRRRAEDVVVNKVTSSQTVFELMTPLIGDLAHEEFWVLFLNNANKILEKQQLSKGGITGTLVDVRLIMKQSVMYGATSIILCHNHPSGTLQVSEPDRKITNKIKKACELLDIRLLDHLIITEKSYLSFTDEGLL